MGFLIHARWAKHVQRFQPIDERIASLDLKAGKWKLRIVTAYFPHSGYGDIHMQRMYHALDDIAEEAKSQKKQLILTGDFNAQVGMRQDEETAKTIGRYGLEPSNQRGLWLKGWAASRHLIIVNTQFKKQPEHMITYVGPNGHEHQLDYILVSRSLWKHTVDAQSTICPDLGSDHKAVQARLRIFGTVRPQKKKSSASRKDKQLRWPPSSIDKFKADLTNSLDDLLLTHDLDERCSQIEDALHDALKFNTTTKQHIPHHASHDNVTYLVKQRRALPNNAPQRAELSKRIKKKIKAIKKMERQQR